MDRLLRNSRRDSTNDAPRSTGEQQSLLASEQHQKLDASQLKFYKGLSRELRPAYMRRALSNGRDTQHLTEQASLTPKGKLLAAGDRFSNLAVCSGYNAFMVTAIVTSIPGSKKLLNAVEKRENNRIKARHEHQQAPFALDTPGVNEAMRRGN